ncbi:MAG: 50S ribosomal protein L4 [Planctomycetota bacterium]
MVTLPVYDQTGSEVGKIDIDPDAIAPKINKQLLHDVVVMYMANKRQGTKKTKTRGQIAGTTKKLFRQKGTGNARAGSKRVPHRRGGGHAMQLKPRSFYYRLPKKAIRAATKMAIASKFSDAEVVVVDKLDLEAPKTKELVTTLRSLGLEGVTTTIATGDYSKNVYLSSRNIQGIEVTRAADLNALDILRPKKLLLTKDAVEWIQAQAGGSAA